MRSSKFVMAPAAATAAALLQDVASQLVKAGLASYVLRPLADHVLDPALRAGAEQHLGHRAVPPVRRAHQGRPATAGTAAAQRRSTVAPLN
jgi:hypothetical protein